MRLAPTGDGYRYTGRLVWPDRQPQGHIASVRRAPITPHAGFTAGATMRAFPQITSGYFW